ncbi:MAG: hypothetical protein AAGI89_07120 [Pseudomonadota bacterium]
MRIARLIALSFWLITSAANAAVNHELCDHPGMSEAGVMGHAQHAMMTDLAPENETEQHHDGCCDGVCLCGTMISTGISPVAPGLDGPQSTASLSLPGTDDANDPIESFDLPPPRLG